MSQNLPAPLVPPDIDLRGLDWMPLFGDRLFGSVTWITAPTSDARIASLRLWWHAFAKEVPAASLPDDDKLLAEYAGYGVAVKAWQRVRPASMRGWIKCADGRLYHPVVAEIAMDAWDRRAASRRKRAADRDRLRGWRDAKKAKETHDETIVKRVSPAPETPRRNGHDTRDETSKTGQDRTGPPQSPVSGPPDGGFVVGRFLDLRRELWPHEDDARLVLLTLRAQADQFIADGATPELVAEVIERGMRQAVQAHKPAPMSLKAFHRSVASATADARPPGTDGPIAAERSPTLWESRLALWLKPGTSTWLSTWRLDECPPAILASFADRLNVKPPPGYRPGA